MKDKEHRRLFDEVLHSRNITEPQRHARIARLIHLRMRQHTGIDRKTIAIACIRMQTFFHGNTER